MEVTGDSDDARRELADVAADLALFGRETAEAEADVDTTSAQANLDELKARLAAISANDVSAEVNIQIAKAQADLAVLQAELDRIDGEDVTVDVDVRRGIVERIASLTGQIDRLGISAGGAGTGGVSSLSSALGEAFKDASLFGVGLSTIAEVAPLVIAAVVSVVGALVAMIASLGSAVGGAGALAVALGSTLFPAVGLAIGAIANFKEESDTAGTAAHALKETFGEVADSFKTATAGGSKQLFSGLADALRDLNPLVKELGPHFTKLGKAGGDAFRLLGKQFSSPAWRKFFKFATDSLTELTPLFARSFGAFAKILANIAQASMPFLLKAFRGLAKGLEALADKTSDIDGLRDSIGGMVDSLRAWGHLLGGIVHLASAFVKAFAPIGDVIVGALGDGANNLADWLESSEGLRKVQQFFEDTGPLASELGKLLLNITLALIQFGELVAPALTPVVHFLNTIFGLLNKVLSFANDHSFGDAFAKAVQPLALVKAALGLIGPAASDAFSTVKDVVGKVIDVVSAPIRFQLEVGREILGVIRDIWKVAKGIVTDVISFVLHAPRDVLGVVRDIWKTAKGIVKDVISFVLHAPRDVLSVIRDIWRTAKGIITDAIDFVLKAPHDVVAAARGIWEEVKGVIKDGISFVFNLPGVSGLKSAAEAIWDSINDALPDIEINIHIPTPSVPHIDIPGAASGVRGFGGGLLRVGEAGEELMLAPQGTDVFNVDETRRILRALADGVARPFSGGAPIPALAGAGGGAGTTIINNVTPIADGGSPDPEVLAAQLAIKMRTKGVSP